MDGPPAQSLGVEPVDERILRAPPRKVTDPIVTRALLTRAISSALLIMFLTLKVFAHELGKSVEPFFSSHYIITMYYLMTNIILFPVNNQTMVM